MLDLILVRHGATAYTEEGRYQGHTDVPLSELGERQVGKLAARLRAEWTDTLTSARVFSSDLLRARQTAETVFAEDSIRFDPRLREANLGQFENRTAAENEAELGQPFLDWLERPTELSPPDGESYSTVRDRLLSWLNDLPVSGVVIAVTHGGPIRTLYSTLLGVDFRIVQGIRVDPTDAVRLRLDRNRRNKIAEPIWLRANHDYRASEQ